MNIALGRVKEYASLPAASDAIIVVLLQSSGLQADSVLRDHDNLSVLLAASNDEATFTNYCVDPLTECLTDRRGWTRYDELQAGDRILAYDPRTHTTQWESPTEIFINERYKGEMWELSMRGFSALTTPDHRWPILHSYGRAKVLRPHVLTTQTLPGAGWSLLRSAPFAGPAGPVYSDAFVRLAAWYFTEGSLIRGGKSITISQSRRHNPVHVEDIRRDLKEIGGQFENRSRPGTPRGVGLFVGERVRLSDDLITWDISGTGVDELIRCVPGREKVPTMEFLTALTPVQARLFTEVCIAGDGSPEKRIFFQHNKARMDAFSVAAVLAGAGPTIGAIGTNCSLNERAPLIHLTNVKRELDDYAGTVWCPVVPSSHWVARRDGKVHITGNTRKSVTSGVTVNVDDTNDWLDIDMADLMWASAGGAVNNTLGKVLFCYDPDTSTGTDTTIVPLSAHDYAEATNGADLTVQLPVGGWLRAA